LNGDQLRQRMQDAGLTVADIASICGTTRRAVEKWRSGEHPCPRLLMLILTALDQNKIDVDWIVDVINGHRSP